jgi:nucleoside-diphosphate-sugar epimerase
MEWQGRPTLVTGGASFIGSHLVDALVARGARVRVADNLSSGRREFLAEHLERGAVDLQVVDLLGPSAVEAAVDGMEVVFHLAADHGGRGYIDTHQVACSTNLILDGQVFHHAARAGVEKVVFASSGCVYPNHLQNDPDEVVYLTEELVRPPYDADNLYGWAKLMGELVLREYCREGRLKGAALRYFTAYGPRCSENHAVLAMIARAFVGEDPFEVWGTGEQVRNWTHVSDIVAATLLAAERIDDGTAVNVGTMERTRVVDAARHILAYTGGTDRLTFLVDKPTGPYNRVCDNRRGRELLGWTPKVSFRDGLHATIDWYFAHHSRDEVASSLGRRLLERT